VARRLYCLGGEKKKANKDPNLAEGKASAVESVVGIREKGRKRSTKKKESSRTKVRKAWRGLAKGGALPYRGHLKGGGSLPKQQSPKNLPSRSIRGQDGVGGCKCPGGGGLGGGLGKKLKSKGFRNSGTIGGNREVLLEMLQGKRALVPKKTLPRKKGSKGLR